MSVARRLDLEISEIAPVASLSLHNGINRNPCNLPLTLTVTNSRTTVRSF
jgi:hypothetical protein